MEYQKITTKVSKISWRNNSEAVTNENFKETPKEIPKKGIHSQKKCRKLLIILILI